MTVRDVADGSVAASARRPRIPAPRARATRRASSIFRHQPLRSGRGWSPGGRGAAASRGEVFFGEPSAHERWAGCMVFGARRVFCWRFSSEGSRSVSTLSPFSNWGSRAALWIDPDCGRQPLRHSDIPGR